MLSDIYNQTITILNKLRASDNDTGKDEWFKTVVTDAAWYTDSARSAGGQSVYIGTYVTVLLPFHDDYLPYMQWKEAGKQDGHFTVSNNDYIIKGIVEEEITANNIVKTMQKYGEDVCTVRHHNEAHDRFGATVQLKIEGV